RIRTCFTWYVSQYNLSKYFGNKRVLGLCRATKSSLGKLVLRKRSFGIICNPLPNRRGHSYAFNRKNKSFFHLPRRDANLASVKFWLIGYELARNSFTRKNNFCKST